MWSDGEPITSDDFKYTWDQITTGKDIYDPTGYDKIESVDDANPKVAVVTFKEPFAHWTQLFGGRLRHLPVAHPGGQGPRQADEGRLQLVRWSVDREVGQGRRASR